MLCSSFNTELLPGVSRYFTRFSAAAEEAGLSRISQDNTSALTTSPARVWAGRWQSLSIGAFCSERNKAIEQPVVQVLGSAQSLLLLFLSHVQIRTLQTAVLSFRSSLSAVVHTMHFWRLSVGMIFLLGQEHRSAYSTGMQYMCHR